MALGSFRGLVADALWLRAEKAKEQQNYFELYQLASWIVKLQPRFTPATVFLAWNMAYNISVACNDHRDRWRWVQKGIELIRDEALPYNPGDPDLLRELGWIYQHKIGQEADDAQKYYKYMLAKDMMRICQPWEPDWEKWATYPQDTEEFREMNYNEQLETLGVEWRGVDQFLKKAEAAKVSLEQMEEVFVENEGQRIGEFFDFWPDEDEPLYEALNRYFRIRWLISERKLYPRVIDNINREYGRLDWRMSESHAIYWAWLGLQKAEGKLNLQCQRMIHQSLASTFKGGRIAYVMVPEPWPVIRHKNVLRSPPNMDDLTAAQHMIIEPNTRVLEATVGYFQKVIKDFPKIGGNKAGFENWLIDAVVTMYSYGENEVAKQLFKELKELVPNKRFPKTVDSFALKEFAQDVTNANYDQAFFVVNSILNNVCLQVALGNMDKAGRLEKMSRRIYHLYNDRIQDKRNQKRRALPPFEQMQATVIRASIRRLHPELSARLQAAIERAVKRQQEQEESEPQ
jgi:hypothetical protein